MSREEKYEEALRLLKGAKEDLKEMNDELLEWESELISIGVKRKQILQ